MKTALVIISVFILGAIINAPLLHAQTPRWVRWGSPGAPSAGMSAAEPHGVVYSDFGVMESSSDSGKSWQNRTRFAGYPQTLGVDPVKKDLYEFGQSISGKNPWIFSRDSGKSWDILVRDDSLYHAGCLSPQGGIFLWLKGHLAYSSDVGKTWDSLGGKDSLPDIVDHLAAGTSKIIFAYNYYWLYRSMDAGVNWSRSLKLDGFHTIYARDSIVILIYVNNGTIRISRDASNHWQSASITASRVSPVDGLVITPTHKIFVSAIVSYDTAKSGIYRSSDFGLSWTRVFENPSALACDSSGVLFAGAYTSFNDGATWQYSNEGIVTASISSLAVGDSGRIYVQGADCYRSTDSTSGWEKTGLLNVTQFFPKIDNQLTAGAKNQVELSSDNGWTWHSLDSGLTGTFTGAVVQPNSTLLASTSDGHVIARLDKTQSIQYQSVEPPEPLLTLLNIGNTSFTASSRHFYSRSDDATTWSEVQLPDTSGVTAISVGPGGFLFVGLRDHTVARSADQGATWGVIRHFPSGFPKCILSLSKSVVVAAMSGDSASPPSGVYLSKDNGISWDSLNLGLHSGDAGRFPKSLAIAYDSLKHRLYLTTFDASNYFIDMLPALREVHVVQEKSSGLLGFPNPCNGVLHLRMPDFKGECSVWITDLLGRRVTSRTLPGHNGAYLSLDVSRLVSGVYTVEVIAQDGTVLRTQIVKGP